MPAMPTFTVITNTRALSTQVTVAAPSDVEALDVAMSHFRRNFVPGYFDPRAEVVFVGGPAFPVPAESNDDPNRGLSEADMDTVLRMESEDFGAA